MDQRSYVKYFVKMGKSANETYQLIKDIYEGRNVDRSNIFKLHGRYRAERDGDEEDFPRATPAKKTRALTEYTIQNDFYYLTMLKRLFKTILKARPKYAERKATWSQLLDNSTPGQSVSRNSGSDKAGVTPMHSLDLASVKREVMQNRADFKNCSTPGRGLP